MSIAKIREVCYTDDGCTLYECLNCYAKIEMRNDIFTHKKNKLTGDWDKELAFKICPYCGCHFEGYILYKKRIKDYDNPNIRTKPILNVIFGLYSRLQDEPLCDWELETKGDSYWVLKRKKELTDKDNKIIFPFEYKIEIIRK